MAIATVQTVVINTTNVDRLVEFWTNVLGVEVARSVPGFVWLKRQREGGVSIAFQEVPDPTEGRNRLHLDTFVEDLAKATEQIVALGGSHLETHEIMGFTWQVMADPDGNEFCIGAH